MQWIILSLLGIAALFVFYQDYNTRSVTWMVFPCLLISGTCYSLYFGDSLETFFTNTAINLVFLVLQFLLLKIVFRHQKLIDRKIGSGDILFAICSCTFFSPVNFLAFYILSLCFSLCIHFSLVQIKKDAYQHTIPLAGLQALFLFLFVGFFIISGTNATDDGWLTATLLP